MNSNPKVESRILTQVRVSPLNTDRVNYSWLWTDYEGMGWIEAARIHAQSSGAERILIDARDALDPSRGIAVFEMVRKVTYECLNSRQGAE
jgi:hypothetical protein